MGFMLFIIGALCVVEALAYIEYKVEVNSINETLIKDLMKIETRYIGKDIRRILKED